MTVKDVASFMLNELKKNGILPQVGLVDIIKEKFGDEFVFETTHGTLTILRNFSPMRLKPSCLS